MDKIIPKFKGIKVYEEEMVAETVTEDRDIEPEKPIRPPKRKSVEIDPKLRVESNEKRLKSLKEKLDFDKKQQILVKEAINSGKRVNKRIVFDDSFGDDINQSLSDNCVKRTDPKQKKLLFDSDSEDDSNEEIDGNKDNNRLKEFELDFDKKINDKNAEKLIELNSRFAHDSRFRIDERFLDKINDNEEVMDESEKNLHLLEEVLGKKLKPIIKSKDKGLSKTPINELFVSRFDPKSDKSSEYEINSSLPKKKSSKRVSFDQKVLAKEEEKSKLEEEVSKEVYYEVSSSLKDSLSQKEEEFSLTQMFGTSSAEDISENSSKDKKVKPIYEKLDNKRKSNVSPNPFKYDSSSSDEEEDNEVLKTKSDSKAIEEKSKPVSSSFRFFFDKNDSRFSEDIFWDKDLGQKARNGWKERQLMLTKSMSVRKRSAKKNKVSDQKTSLKFKKNPNFKHFSKKVNKSLD